MSRAAGGRRAIRILLLTAGISTLILTLFLRAPLAKEPGGIASQQQPTPEVTPDRLLAESLAEKDAIERRFLTASNQSQAAPPPRNRPPAGGLAPIDDPPFQTGILEGVAGPFSSQDIVVVNLWQDELDTGFLQVFAGAYGLDPNRGVLVVLLTSGDRLHAAEERYPAPEANGALRIIGVEGTVLNLVAEDGTELSFELQSRQYSSHS
jgi:hypothetical protein